jgi:hypothetical protein
MGTLAKNNDVANCMTRPRLPKRNEPWWCRAVIQLPNKSVSALFAPDIPPKELKEGDVKKTQKGYRRGPEVH